MSITRRLAVPTGDICIWQGEKGNLEFLSLGDYGQDVNLNQHKAVVHQPIMPLTEKWVVRILMGKVERSRNDIPGGA